MNSYTVTSDDEPCKCSDRFEMMNKRLKAAEKLLEPLSVLEVCGNQYQSMLHACWLPSQDSQPSQ